MITPLITATAGNGNGTAYPAPTSRRAFVRSAPGRIGALEDQIEAHELRLDAIADQLPDPDLCAQLTAADQLLIARIDNLVETVEHLTKSLKRIDRRSLRQHRKLAAMAAQVASRS
jgi:hypothetical protein